jgi:hypothetical protein
MIGQIYGNRGGEFRPSLIPFLPALDSKSSAPASPGISRKSKSRKHGVGGGLRKCGFRALHFRKLFVIA